MEVKREPDVQPALPAEGRVEVKLEPGVVALTSAPGFQHKPAPVNVYFQ